MAKAKMGKSMGDRECGWVRARLPLWVDQCVDTEQSDFVGDRRDLAAKESIVISRHLAECACCRQHGLDLERALGALAVAAADLAVLPEAPSLWPELERRLSFPDARDKAREPRAADGDGLRRPLSELDGDRAIRQAWTRDTIGELLASSRSHGSSSTRTSDLFLRLSVAATILGALIQFQILRQRRGDADAVIISNIAPLAEPFVRLPNFAEPPQETLDLDKNEVPPNQLAEADPPRPAENPAAAIEAAPMPKSSAPTRFGFDLDHGTPMPPDSRDAKPVY